MDCHTEIKVAKPGAVGFEREWRSDSGIDAAALHGPVPRFPAPRAGNAGASPPRTISTCSDSDSADPGRTPPAPLICGDSAAATPHGAGLAAHPKVSGAAATWSTRWGWSFGEAERAAITALPTSAWSPALAADGDVRGGTQVAELTGLLHPAGLAGQDAGHRPQ